MDVVCRLHQRLADVYPASDIDVCVVGIFHQVGSVTMSLLHGTSPTSKCVSSAFSTRREQYRRLRSAMLTPSD